MKNLPYDYFYLGAALSIFADLNFMDWKFYVIVVPFVILNVLTDNKTK